MEETQAGRGPLRRIIGWLHNNRLLDGGPEVLECGHLCAGWITPQEGAQAIARRARRRCMRCAQGLPPDPEAVLAMGRALVQFLEAEGVAAGQGPTQAATDSETDR